MAVSSWTSRPARRTEKRVRSNAAHPPSSVAVTTTAFPHGRAHLGHKRCQPVWWPRRHPPTTTGRGAATDAGTTSDRGGSRGGDVTTCAGIARGGGPDTAGWRGSGACHGGGRTVAHLSPPAARRWRHRRGRNSHHGRTGVNALERAVAAPTPRPAAGVPQRAGSSLQARQLQLLQLPVA